ncbi:unnamed protein product [Protopolystoma xenopodis]|uniref:IRS-type PTB domain-containing protein n=1 Tax=Protopolystoma xenopodis TaxID=117903 RepID=A0A448WZR3_9PLAT|nr:unnamed protein product [Protopolystoma xenopodis]
MHTLQHGSPHSHSLSSASPSLASLHLSMHNSNELSSSNPFVTATNVSSYSPHSTPTHYEPASTVVDSCLFSSSQSANFTPAQICSSSPQFVSLPISSSHSSSPSFSFVTSAISLGPCCQSSSRLPSELMHRLASQQLPLRLSWPLTSLRRFGFHGCLLRLEAGRRAPRGEGYYVFCVKQLREFRQLFEVCFSYHV